MSAIIALDAMGGDHGTTVTVPAAIAVVKSLPNVSLILVGQEDIVRAELARLGASESERLRVHHASQTVDMDEDPRKALRGKKDSSMRVAINLVKEGEAQACVSAGNTGALMATAHFVLRTLPGIDRPAIIKILPTIKGHVHMLDLGANVDCSAEQLLQFGVMGAAMVSATEGKAAPTVALLNNGEEDIKGNEVVKQASALLKQTSLNYVGYAEGDEIYTGDVDVIVCDGFVGNVALKTTEGLAAMMTHFLKREFSRNWLTRLQALLALSVLKAFRRTIDPRRYNGASLVGLNGIVVKSHGGTDALGFESAIRVAVTEASNQVPRRVRDHLAAVLGEEIA